jgi:peptide-methionine (S)-S-oxide reductase
MTNFVNQRFKMISADDELLFREAVTAIDSGNITLLEGLLSDHPNLVRERLGDPTEGYFKNPYLLWFVADNPIRIDKLPANILDITRLLISFVRSEAPDSMQEQFDYALELAASGSVPQECGVQLELMDLLIDAGAKPGGGENALAHGNIAAAEHLIERGGKLTLTTAIGLKRMDDVARLAMGASKDDRTTALAMAAFYGKSHMISFLLGMGADPNSYPESDSGFHSHATPLHQAVSSGSLESVKVLVEAGANIKARDKVYDGTPLDWAEYLKRDNTDENAKRNFALIEEYLSGLQE